MEMKRLVPLIAVFLLAFSIANACDIIQRDTTESITHCDNHDGTITASDQWLNCKNSQGMWYHCAVWIGGSWNYTIIDTGKYNVSINVTDIDGAEFDYRTNGSRINLVLKKVQDINMKNAITGRYIEDGQVIYTFGSDSRFYYTPSITRLKEEFMLGSADIKTNKDLDVEWRIKDNSDLQIYLDGVQWDGSQTKSANTIQFYKNGKLLVNFQRPFVQDSNGSFMWLQYNIKNTGQTFITLNIPKSWLQSAVFPIYIDPTTTLSEGQGFIVGDTYVDSMAPTSNFGTQIYLQVGYNIGNCMNSSYTLINFTSLNVFATEITDAKLFQWVAVDSPSYAQASYLSYCNAIFNETTMTFNNHANQVPTSTCTFLLQKTIGGNSYTMWDNLTLTNQTQLEASADKIFTVKQSASNCGGGNYGYDYYYSRDYTSNTSRKPYFEITYTTDNNYVFNLFSNKTGLALNYYGIIATNGTFTSNYFSSGSNYSMNVAPFNYTLPISRWEFENNSDDWVGTNNFVRTYGDFSYSNTTYAHGLYSLRLDGNNDWFEIAGAGEIVDDCNATTGWVDNPDATTSATVGGLDGYNYLQIARDGTTTNSSFVYKTITSMNFTGKNASMNFYVYNQTYLDMIDFVYVIIGTNSSNYYRWMFNDAGNISTGWNIFKNMTSSNPSGTIGTPNPANITYIQLYIRVKSNSSVWTAGQVGMDNWKFSNGTYKDLDAGSGNFSFATWVYPNSSATTNQYLISKLDAPFNAQVRGTGWNFYINYQTGMPVLAMGDGINAYFPDTNVSTNAITEDTWTHIVLVVDKTNKITYFYKNGVLDRTRPYSSTVDNLNNLAPFRLGINYAIAGDWLGYIDDFRYYDTALSSLEASTIYSTGEAVTGFNLPQGNSTVTYYKSGYVTSNTSKIFARGGYVSGSSYPAGLIIYAVKDETTLAGLTFNVTIFNSTSSVSFNSITSLEKNSTEIPNGDVTLIINNASGGYEQRYFYTTINDLTLVNNTYYLLANTDGLIRSFFVKDMGQNSIPNALVTIKRFIGGSWTIIATKLTDSSGTTAFLLNPSTQYQVSACANSGTGQCSSTSTITPSEAEYTIFIDTGVTRALTNIFDTVGFVIQPAFVSLGRSNATSINFTVTCTSNDLVRFWAELRDENNTLISNLSSTSSNGGSVNSIVDSTNLSRIYGTFFITRTGFPTFQTTKNWLIRDFGAGNYSFFTILSSSFKNMTGMSDFAKSLVSIFLILGVMAGCNFYLGVGAFGSSLIGIIVLTIMTLFGFFNIPALIVMWIALIGYLVMTRGGY